MRDVNINNKCKQQEPMVPYLLSIIGFLSITLIIIYFREGFIVDKNPVYIMVFTIFLLLSLWASVHYLLLIGRTFRITQKLSKAHDLNAVSNVFKESKNSVFTQIWEKYQATFVNENEETSVLSVMTRADADLYFTSDEIIDKAWLRLPFTAFMKLIPSSFIGLGILGTFIGFSQSVNFDTNAVDVSQLKSLFGGLSVAFGTSIIGVLTSLIFN